MNKVITINLGGNAYQLEEGGYDALRAYLESASARLAGNPDRDEILSDIERAIADKFRALLVKKTVVETKEVAAVLAEMGPIEADGGEAREAGANPGPIGGGTKAGEEARASASSGAARRLYRIPEGAMLAGVCNGIAAYFNIDPTLVRLGFVFLTIFWGTGLLVYVVMAFVVPEARSPEEKSAASGNPMTAQEFIRRAKEGYYEAMKNFPDGKARREWSRQFKQNMRENAYQWQRGWRWHWHGYCPQPPAPVNPGMIFALPFFSLMNGAAFILVVCTLISILGTGSVFGRPLPGDLPVWGAVVVVLLIYGVLTGPLKMARSACYRGMGSAGWYWSFVFLLDAMIWVVVAIALACLAVQHFPEVQNAFHSVPPMAHQAADSVKAWWNQK